MDYILLINSKKRSIRPSLHIILQKVPTALDWQRRRASLSPWEFWCSNSFCCSSAFALGKRFDQILARSVHLSGQPSDCCGWSSVIRGHRRRVLVCCQCLGARLTARRSLQRRRGLRWTANIYVHSQLADSWLNISFCFGLTPVRMCK